MCNISYTRLYTDTHIKMASEKEIYLTNGKWNQILMDFDLIEGRKLFHFIFRSLLSPFLMLSLYLPGESTELFFFFNIWGVNNETFIPTADKDS